MAGGISARLLRLGRPQKFLGALPLSTGASLITLSLAINKLAGLYGILALLTGYHLSTFQLSMYLYSFGALIITCILGRHIRTQSPLQCLALAWFYVLDSIINAAFTVAFAVTWFLVLAGSDADSPGKSTMDQISGFTDPEFNVSRVEILATPNSDLGPNGGQDAVAAGIPAPTAAGPGTGTNGALQQAVLGTESMNSIGIIIALWTVRAYFCLIMLAFARMVLRQHIMSSGAKQTTYTAASTSSSLAENPFADSKPEGQGWRGKLGRFMVSIGRSYWLGSDEDDSWMYGMKFRNSADADGIPLGKVESGPSERERRRRSGTGPPLPPAAPAVTKDDGTLQVPAPTNL